MRNKAILIIFLAAIFINNPAQAQDFSATEKISNFSVAEKLSAKSQEELRIKNYELRDCKFAYRDSVFKQNPDIVILSCVLNLKKGDSKQSQQKIVEIMKQRKALQPYDFPSSGSFFKNARTKDSKLIREFEEDTGAKVKDNVIPAGYLIDRLGLRGKKIGGVMVSEKHGNFFVNTGKAKSDDVIILASLIKQKVRNNFGIQLQEEVRLVGF